ncbi:methyltransferase [Aureococcus anophagefferens]|nr:methyltransferase [Aureococcus anophagefferens]
MAALLSAVALVASVCVGQDAATAARLPLAPPRAVDAVELAAALGAAAGVRGDARGGRVGVTRAETADGAREFWVAAPSTAAAGASTARRPLAAVLAEVDSAVVVDVGAHCGYFSLLAATGGARAVALEPNAEHHPLLRLGAALNGVGDDAIALFGAPAADVAEVAYDGWSTDDAGRPGFNASASTPRRAVRCDDAVEAAEAGWGAPVRPIAWLKVDVEGQELAALRSAARLLDRPPGLRPGVAWVELSWLDGDAASLGAAAATVALLVRRGYDVRAAREGGIAWDCAESAHDCDDPPRDSRGEGWLDVVDIERGYEAEGARRLLEAAGYCDRREAAAAAMNARQARAAGGEAADFSMYVAVGEEAHQVLFSGGDGTTRSALFHAGLRRGHAPVSRELCDASCDATLAELREKRARRRRRAAEAS